MKQEDPAARLEPHGFSRGVDVKRYRLGRKLDTTLYEQLGEQPSDEDRLLGYGYSPETAREMVDLLNAAHARGERDRLTPEQVRALAREHGLPWSE